MNFSEFVRSAGLIPGDVFADGRWYRCATESHPRKKNGSYKLLESGTLGFCQDHAIHASPLTWKAERDVRPFVDRASIKRKREDTQKALVQATKAARKFYFECALLVGGHPYLDSHSLSMFGCAGLKIDPDGWLVVPVMLERDIISVQRISPEGEKRFWSGASVKGGSYAIDRKGASITVLCEGLATGLAIFSAVSLCRVVVAFDSGNLGRVAVTKRGLVCVACDNDHQTALRIGKNPGVEAAAAAAKALGCGIAIPEGFQGSDWCDWRNERVAWMLADKPKAREGVIRRVVDAEISAVFMRNATFLHS